MVPTSLLQSGRCTISDSTNWPHSAFGLLLMYICMSPETEARKKGFVVVELSFLLFPFYMLWKFSTFEDLRFVVSFSVLLVVLGDSTNVRLPG